MYLNFCSNLFNHIGKGLAKKARLITSTMTSQTGE